MSEDKKVSRPIEFVQLRLRGEALAAKLCTFGCDSKALFIGSAIFCHPKS
jgi:hypothetical protein